MPSTSSAEARLTLAMLVVLALAGVALGWNKGQLPHPIEPVASATADADISPDLALYRDVIAEVRSGRDYYAVAGERIPHYGFPIGSPLNWRLPTYAWLFSWLPGPTWIQAALVALSIVALGLAFVAQSRVAGVGYAALRIFLLFGVVHWAIDGQAYLAQEPWAATLMIVSLSAHALAAQQGRWRVLAVAAGIAALLFRELALPYCLVACAFAAHKRRWSEAAGWAAGIALFFGFFAWHVGQVKAQLAGTEVAGAAGLAQWLRFGGLDFILLTTRMNSLLFAASPWLLWLFLLLSLVGLSRSQGESNNIACLAALLYLVGFAVVGRPENFYWGLMPAPLVAWGSAQAPRCLAELWQKAAFVTSPAATDQPLVTHG